MDTEKKVAKFNEISELLHVNAKSDLYKENRDMHKEVVIEIIQRADSDISVELFDQCFDSSYKATKFGEYLILTSFCISWLNDYFSSEKSRDIFLSNDDDRNDKFRNTYFAYLAYLHLGDDFLVGNIIENVFKQIGHHELSKSRHADLEINGINSIHALAVASYDGIEWLMTKHYGPKHNPRLYLNLPKEKRDPEPSTHEIYLKLGALAKM